MAHLPGPRRGEAKVGLNGEMLLCDLVNDDVPRCQVRIWRSARAGWRGGRLEPPCESSGTTDGSAFFLCCRNHFARIQVAGATDAFVQHCKNWGPRLLAEGQQYVPYFDLAVDDAPRDGTGKGKDSDGKGKGGGGGQYDDDLGSRVAGAGRWLPYAGHTGTGKPCKGKPWEYGRPYAGSDSESEDDGKGKGRKGLGYDREAREIRRQRIKHHCQQIIEHGQHIIALLDDY